jgi:urease accessory protein
MRIPSRPAAAFVLCVAATAAAAHTGHPTASWIDGVVHPVAGADHLLAMLAVGLWSAAALPAGRRLAGPLIFMLALTCGAAAGASGFVPGWLESALAASVALLGAMLIAPGALPVAAAGAAIAAAGLLHGLAHGAELPPGGLIGAYAAGFLLTTAALHVAGLRLGAALQRLPLWTWRATAVGIGLTGALMLARI